MASFVNTAPYVFALRRQEDAHEALVQILHNVHRTMQEPVQDGNQQGEIYQQSIINDSFSGKLFSKVQCSNCKYTSGTIDSFLDLSIEISGPSIDINATTTSTVPSLLTKIDIPSQSKSPSKSSDTSTNLSSTSSSSSSTTSTVSISNNYFSLSNFPLQNITSFFNNISTSVTSTFTKVTKMKEENISLEKCMSKFFQIENMTGANKYDCCRCPTHKQDGTKQMSIDSTGEMLCLHLKRFDGVGKKKQNCHLSFK